MVASRGWRGYIQAGCQSMWISQPPVDTSWLPGALWARQWCKTSTQWWSQSLHSPLHPQQSYSGRRCCRSKDYWQHQRCPVDTRAVRCCDTTTLKCISRDIIHYCEYCNFTAWGMFSWVCVTAAAPQLCSGIFTSARVTFTVRERGFKQHRREGEAGGSWPNTTKRGIDAKKRENRNSIV